MATLPETINDIIAKLGSDRFSSRRMFGEYALYADGKTVGLVCDDRLYVKITPESTELESICEQGQPYPGAKPWYIVDEGQIAGLRNLRQILLDIAEKLPAKKRK